MAVKKKIPKPKKKVLTRKKPVAKKPKASAKSKTVAGRSKDKGLGEEVGKVVAFYAVPSAAIVEIKKGSLKLGDTIWIRGHTSDFKETIRSMQINHQSIEEAKKGKPIGIQVSKKARANDRVYRIQTS